MLDRRRTGQTRVGRAARAMAKLAGLITVSVMAGGCSLLPFGGGGSRPSAAAAAAPRGMRPEIHEVAANPHADCLAAPDAGSGGGGGNGGVIWPGERRPAAATAQRAAAPQAAGCTACACGGTGAAPGTGAIAQLPEDPAPLRTTDPVVAVGSPAEEELQRLMDGNKRFVEGEAENVFKWPARPGEENKRPPAAMVLACSDWGVLPEAAFDTRAGELFVVQVAGAVTDEAVIESAKYAVQQYEIPLIIVLGHEDCGAVEASLILKDDAVDGRQARRSKTVPDREADARPAHDAEGAKEAEGGEEAAMTPVDRAVHDNVNEAVEELAKADPAIAARVAAGRLKIVGAFYDETNGQITLQAETDAAADPAVGPIVDVPKD